jgi:hypothetical protein
VDLLGSAAVIVLSLFFGFYLPKQNFDRLRDDAKQEDDRKNINNDLVEDNNVWDEGNLPLVTISAESSTTTDETTLPL